MKFHEGVLLRIARLRAGLEQKEIVGNICSVSTLSKIETGRQKAHPEMLASLFNVLGIVYETDETFIQEAKSSIDECFNNTFYGHKCEVYPTLAKQKERLIYSPLVLDWLLLGAFHEDGVDMTILHACKNNMNDFQLGLYLICNAQQVDFKDSIAEVEKASYLLNNAFGHLAVLSTYYMNGMYQEILEGVDAVIQRAVDEGNIWVLVRATTMKGDVYSGYGIEEMMLEEYRRVLNLLKYTSWTDLIKNVHYNIGATQLGHGHYEEAKENLDQANFDNPLYYHKRCLLSARTGDIVEARRYLDLMEQRLHMNRYEPFIRDIYEITKLEVNGERYSMEAMNQLEALLDNLYELKRYGFMIFFKNDLKACYKHHRKYKKALELEELFSSIKGNGVV